jgi:predicted dinucleotide-binding enzyme
MNFETNWPNTKYLAWRLAQNERLLRKIECCKVVAGFHRTFVHKMAKGNKEKPRLQRVIAGDAEAAQRSPIFRKSRRLYYRG